MSPRDLGGAPERLPRRIRVTHQALRVAQAEQELDVPCAVALTLLFEHTHSRGVGDRCLLVRSQ